MYIFIFRSSFELNEMKSMDGLDAKKRAEVSECLFINKIETICRWELKVVYPSNNIYWGAEFSH